MPEFVTDNLRDGYRRIVADVKAHGDEVTVKGARTREILGYSIVLTRPQEALPVGVGRKLNPAIAAVEAAQLIAGESHPDLVCRIAPNFRNYMDGGVFHGAYGPRVRSQYWQVVDRLRQDENSRQAVMTIWQPQIDNQPGLRDYPCTTALQFFVRNGMVDMQVYMRSNDVWRGLAYDAFQFTQLQFSVAYELGREVGTYRHYAASLHLYESDREAATRMLNEQFEQPDGSPDHRAAGLTVNQARAVLRGYGTLYEGDSPSTDWYTEKLARYFR